MLAITSTVENASANGRFGSRCASHKPTARQYYANRSDKPRGPVTNDTFAQAQQRADCRSDADREQTHRRGFGHRQTEAEHQQWHGKNAAARTGQGQHQADNRPESGAKQTVLGHGACTRGRASHSRPLSMQRQ